MKRPRPKDKPVTILVELDANVAADLERIARLEGRSKRKQASRAVAEFVRRQAGTAQSAQPALATA